jgi:phage head maturation protease
MDLEQFLDAGLPEFRSVPFLDFEAKDDGWAFEGLAAVYGKEGDLGEFTEEFRHGAFRKPLSNGDNTRLIYEHARRICRFSRRSRATRSTSRMT